MNDPEIVQLFYKIAEIAAIISGVGATIYRLGGMAKEFRMMGKFQADQIDEMKTTLKELANQNIRLNIFEERQMLQGKRLDRIETSMTEVLFSRRGFKESYTPIDPA